MLKKLNARKLLLRDDAMILISACLAGENVKYSGGNNAVPWLCQWIEKHRDQVLLVCPEVMGGLTVPRLPAEIQRRRTKPEDCRVVNKAGEDVTAQFRLGAEKVLELAKAHHISVAILKGNSPSCGNKEVYDGTFSGILVPGSGIAASLLIANGVMVLSEKTVTPEILEKLVNADF